MTIEGEPWTDASKTPEERCRLYLAHEPKAGTAEVMAACDVSKPTAILWRRRVAAEGGTTTAKAGSDVEDEEEEEPAEAPAPKGPAPSALQDAFKPSEVARPADTKPTPEQVKAVKPRILYLRLG